MIGTILLQRGQHFRSEDDVKEAVGYLEDAIKRDSRNQQMMFNLAGAYAILTDYQKATTTLEKLLKVNPNHTAAQNLLTSLPEN